MPTSNVCAPSRRSSLRVLLAASLALLSSHVASQAVDGAGTSAPAARDGVLRIDLGDGRVATLTHADLARLPLESAMATLRDRPPFPVQGVSITVLLRLVGLDLGANLGSATVVGKALVARAADGYVAVFGLADVDPHFGHAPLMVVWTREEGRPLPPREGPFMLVNTAESRPGRWVRQLQELEVRDLR